MVIGVVLGLLEGVMPKISGEMGEPTVAVEGVLIVTTVDVRPSATGL